MKTISRFELNREMRNFVKKLLDYDNLSVSFDENGLYIGVVHYDMGEQEKKDE